MKADQLMRRELLALLQGGNAHMSFDEVVAEFPPEFINKKPPHTPYACWHFLEHLRITQWDILEFIRDPHHVSPPYPEGYRPPPEEKASEAQWLESCDRFRADLEALQQMVRDEGVELLAPLAHAPKYTVFREVILAADHNAYHIGELAILRQVLDIWPAHNRYLTGQPD